MNYKKISFFVIIGIVVVSLGGAVILTINHSKHNLTSSLIKYSLASLLTQPIQTQPSGNFAVLAYSTITNTGSTVVNGDLGLSPGTSVTGFPPAGPGVINGTQHITNEAAANAQIALTEAYGLAAGKSCTQNLTGTNLGNLTLTPGVYCFDSSAQLTGTLTLDGGNNANAVFIFKIGDTLTTASGAPGNPGSKVILTNDAQSCNVFWQVGSSATLETYTNFIGNIMALVSITLNTGATVDGRVLASTGAVTLDTNTITLAACGASVSGTCGSANGSSFSIAPTSNLCSAGSATSVTGTGPWVWTCTGLNGGTDSSCTATVSSATATLTLVKVIVGGTRTFTNFPLTATGPTTITGDSATPAVTAAIVNAGTYTLSETTQSNYTAESWSCLKNAIPPAVIGASITLAPDDNVICTIQNTYITPSGVGGGSSYYPPAAPLIDVAKVPSLLALPNGPGPVIYTYTLRNIGTVPVNNITMIDDTCSPIIFVSGDTNGDSRLDVDETWTYNCSETLSATNTNTVVATGWANSVSATDIATATVVVGVPIVPPLIHVTKAPSPLTLPAGGGMVTYTKKVTNPGTVALSNIQIADDKCDTVKYVSGDTNSDLKLDPTETWTYTCQTNLTKTTTNTVIVSGQANGLTARDFGIITVIVATPKLPNTGFPPSSLPIRLRIPKINVDVPIDSVGITPNGSVGVPKGPDNVAWFDLGPRPGENGSAVITGHYGPWKNGRGSVFDDLNKLSPGDRIYIEDENGTTTIFAVRELQMYNHNEYAPGVFSSGDEKSHLNLVTCEGTWIESQKTYSNRLVVFADKE